MLIRKKLVQDGQHYRHQLGRDGKLKFGDMKLNTPFVPKLLQERKKNMGKLVSVEILMNRNVI